MTKFITGKNLDDKVGDIIWKAEEQLMIVSPFIKLDQHFRKLFEHHLGNYKVHLLIVFGKNDGNANRSLNKDDFDFFKQFPNVSIVYVPNLHAKYYGNEKAGVITSINLYDFSFRNNIEYGVYTETGLLNNMTKSADQGAWEKSWEIANQGDVVFIKRPVLEKKLLSGKNYVSSDVLLDETDYFYGAFSNRKLSKKKLDDYDEYIDLGKKKDAPRPEREVPAINNTGYCIRDRREIPFNVNKPYCEQCYNSWNQWKNMDYSEKYCHKTGKESNGRTSMRKPVL